MAKFAIYNMRYQKVEYRRQSRWGGGLYARQPIRRGEVVATFDGAIYEWGKSVNELPNDPPFFLRDHIIQCGEGLSRDSAAGLGRYANHSCHPNCGIKDLFDIVAMEDIPQGAEITWDYAMTENNEWSMTCRCGAPECRKLITGYRNLPPEIRTKYTGFISQWLIDADIPYAGPAEAREWPPAAVPALVEASPFTLKTQGPLAS